MTEQQKLRELLENSSHIVFFGGACFEMGSAKQYG